jgi:hypothetical protein
MKRKFNYPEFSMLVAALEVVENFEAHKQIFIEDYPLWEDPFCEVFRIQINRALAEYFNIRTKEELLSICSLMGNISIRVLEDLTILKQQIEGISPKSTLRVNETLDKLGFQPVRDKSLNKQTEILSLLFSVCDNIDDKLASHLKKNGVNPDIINNLQNSADILHAAEMNQSGPKGTPKLNTNRATIILNDIYAKARKICSCGYKSCRYNRKERDLFVFSKIANFIGLNFLDDNHLPIETNVSTQVVSRW